MSDIVITLEGGESFSVHGSAWPWGGWAGGGTFEDPAPDEPTAERIELLSTSGAPTVIAHGDVIEEDAAIAEVDFTHVPLDPELFADAPDPQEWVPTSGAPRHAERRRLSTGASAVNRREPPETEDELLRRARGLAGRTLAAISEPLDAPVPPDQRRAKGWVGQLIEAALGAPGGSEAGPDFPALGVELKTLPIDRRGRPRESTWVCYAPLDGSLATEWEVSWVACKLARVLWVPVEADPGVPLASRRVGTPLLWTPDAEEERALRADWEELTELLRQGRHEELTAHRGRWLQVRPKAASGRSAVWTVGAEGEWALANPRGFYLRARFTEALLRRHWVLPGGGSG